MVVSFLAFSLGTITLENPGIRLELFLKEMSNQSGQPFHCTAYLNNEVLAASFTDQSIDIVKSQLARVIHGTWTQKDDGLWLIQTPDQKKEEEKWMWDSRNMVLQTQIDSLKAVAPTTEWTIKEAEKYWLDLKASRKKTGEAIWTAERRRALRLQSPESRLCARIASQLTVKMFIENPLQFNINRYSNCGLPGHITLPIDFDAELRRYESERLLFQQLGETTENPKKAVHVELRYSSVEREYIFFSWLDKDWKYVGNSFPSVYLNAKTFLAQGESFPVSKETQEILDIQKDTEDYPLEPTFVKYKNSSIFADAVATMSNATSWPCSSFVNPLSPSADLWT